MDELKSARDMARKYENELREINIREFEVKAVLSFICELENEIIAKKLKEELDKS